MKKGGKDDSGRKTRQWKMGGENGKVKGASGGK